MRGLLKAGVVLAPALARAVSLEEGEFSSGHMDKSNWNESTHAKNQDTIPSAFITLPLPETDEATHTQELIMRLDIHESADACGYGNVSINGQDLAEKGSGTFVVDEGRIIDASWNLTCVNWNDVPQEQLLSVNVDFVDGRSVEDVGFTLRFQQVAPVWISDVEGTASMTRIHSAVQTKAPCDDDKKLDVDLELAELEYLRWQVDELHHQIFMKERRLQEAFGGPKRHPHTGRPLLLENCDSLKCVIGSLFDKAKGAAFSMYGYGFAGHARPGHRRPGPHGKPPGPWGRHDTHEPHGDAHAHGQEGGSEPDWPHHNHTHNGTHPHPPPPHHGHPPPFCRCDPSPPHHGGPSPPPPPPFPPHAPGDHEGFKPHHGGPHGPGFEHHHKSRPDGHEHGPDSEHQLDGPDGHKGDHHGAGREHHKEGHHHDGPKHHDHENSPGAPKGEQGHGSELEHPEAAPEQDHQPFPDEPDHTEMELRRDFDHHGPPPHPPFDFDGPPHDEPHGPPPHDGPQDGPHDGPHGPPMHEGPHGPPHGPPPHHGGPPPGLIFVHIASILSTVILLGVFLRILYQRCFATSTTQQRRRRDSYSTPVPWYKQLLFGPSVDDEDEEKEAMLHGGDDTSSDAGDESDPNLVARDTSNFRTAADVVSEMVAIEEARARAAAAILMQQHHSRASSLQYAPVMPLDAAAAAAALFPELDHDEVLPAYQEAPQSEDGSISDDAASEAASSLMADGYRPGGAYTPSESGSHGGAGDILGDTKN